MPGGAGNGGSGALRVGPAPPLHAAGDPAAALRAAGLRLRPRAAPARPPLRARRPARRLPGPGGSSSRTGSSSGGRSHTQLRPGAPGVFGHAPRRARAPGLDGRHPGGARPPGRGHPPLPGHGHDRRRACPRSRAAGCPTPTWAGRRCRRPPCGDGASCSSSGADDGRRRAGGAPGPGHGGLSASATDRRLPPPLRPTGGSGAAPRRGAGAESLRPRPRAFRRPRRRAFDGRAHQLRHHRRRGLALRRRSSMAW